MKLTTRIAAGIFCTVVACSVAKADGLIGSTVTGTLYNPNLSTILGGPTTAVVGASDPTFPNSSIVGNTPFQIDITGGQIIYKPLQNVTYGSGAFNGFVFTFTGAPAILGVTLDPTSTFTPAGFSFTSNSISLNLSGNTVTVDSVATLDLTLAPTTPPSPVPEPATWVLLLGSIGLIGSAHAMRRSMRHAITTR